MRHSLILGCLLLAACASRPPMPAALDEGLDGVIRIENRERSAALWTTADFAWKSLPLPQVGLAEGAMLDGLDPKTVSPVLRELGRAFCFALGERLPLKEDPSTVLAIELVALRKSEGNAVSALIDLAVPGPARLPVGLGGLSVRLRLLEEGKPVALYAWSRGANSLRENARLSPIADAWQLASRFPLDFLRDTNLRSLPKRPAPERQTDRARCEARFGKSDPVLRGAGRLLPLPPEWSEDAAAEAPASAPEAPEAQTDSEED